MRFEHLYFSYQVSIGLFQIGFDLFNDFDYGFFVDKSKGTEPGAAFSSVQQPVFDRFPQFLRLAYIVEFSENIIYAIYVSEFFYNGFAQGRGQDISPENSSVYTVSISMEFKGEEALEIVGKSDACVKWLQG